MSKDSRNDYGLTPFQLVDMAVLHEDGTECYYNEYGRLVANSPCTMKGYKDNEEASLNFYLKDAHGRIWGDCCVWAYIGKNGNVHMKGRMGNEINLTDGKKIPNSLIAETILEDIDNILSCEVVNIEDTNDIKVVAHIQLNPMCQTGWNDVFEKANSVV